MSECVKDKTLLYPEQVCTKCSSSYEYHLRHSKNQKKCKCCNVHFNNAHAPFNPSQNLVADKTYIKINGKRHYVWIIYDHDKETVVSYHISDMRDTKACITAIVKVINKYLELPKELNFALDAYTAYPLALQYIAKEYNIKINHSSVKGLQIQVNEDSDTRIAKQQIERLNCTFKESYRITTGYGTLKRAIASFEL
ncbi:hypothetical protein RN96_06740 [Fusobacterium polymorphum]|uniref:DDE domain-containing protein n=1 Tax=Fusobacterium nucleatum subsp. polymorphum TaxID=76857 RepID=A0A2B7YPK4_FUSNP|nr:DDE-type integrase/transposase/recombinase [Fusobacterium polymorphum]PGH22782.1 hypothetical protein RN96_06740 [Fusobacterium polymorphum]